MKRSARAGPSRSNNAPPPAAGAPCKASPTSPLSSPTWTQPPNGDSTNTTPSANSSPPAHGYHPHSNQLNSYLTTSNDRHKLLSQRLAAMVISRQEMGHCGGYSDGRSYGSIRSESNQDKTSL